MPEFVAAIPADAAALIFERMAEPERALDLQLVAEKRRHHLQQLTVREVSKTASRI